MMNAAEIHASRAELAVSADHYFSVLGCTLVLRERSGVHWLFKPGRRNYSREGIPLVSTAPNRRDYCRALSSLPGSVYHDVRVYTFRDFHRTRKMAGRTSERFEPLIVLLLLIGWYCCYTRDRRSQRRVRAAAAGCLAGIG